MTYFEEIKRRMPHFFNNISVLEYVPHNKCKTVEHLFNDCHYVVLDPNTNDLSGVQQDAFTVAMSIDRFHTTDNYLEEFRALHKVSRKLVMFSCAAAGKSPRGTGYWRNLTEADFNIDLEAMFDPHHFYADYENSQLYFWGIKRDRV